MRRAFFYSTIKYPSTLNLNPTASFNSMKGTLINRTSPIYTVDNLKLNSFSASLKFLISLFISLYIDSPFYLSIGFCIFFFYFLFNIFVLRGPLGRILLGPVYTGQDKFLHGQKRTQFHVAFTRDRQNWANF